jgi:hypothetical protein
MAEFLLEMAAARFRAVVQPWRQEMAAADLVLDTAAAELIRDAAADLIPEAAVMDLVQEAAAMVIGVRERWV